MHPRRAASLPAARAGAWPHRTSRPLACGKGGCVAARDKPPPCLRQGRARGRTGQAALLPAARAGAWPHGTSRLLACRKGGCVTAQDKPPSCLRQGRVRDRTGQAASLPTARAGGLHPRRAAFLRSARAESLILQPDGTTRTRGNDTHARASASGPKREVKFFRPFEKRPQQANNAGRKIIDPHQGPPPQRRRARNKVLCQAFFQESGGSGGVEKREGIWYTEKNALPFVLPKSREEVPC